MRLTLLVQNFALSVATSSQPKKLLLETLHMYQNQSPIETLAAFALAFAAGAVVSLAIATYGAWMKSKGEKDAAAS